MPASLESTIRYEEMAVVEFHLEELRKLDQAGGCRLL